MKRILILLIILIYSGGAKLLSNSSTSAKDSLLKVLETLPADTTRLDMFITLVHLDPMSPSSLTFLDQMLEEAIQQDNKYYECYAVYSHLVDYFNHQGEENVNLWMEKLEKLALENKFHDFYFLGKRVHITMRIIAHKIEYSITEAEEMYELAQKLNHPLGMSRAKLCMMTAYLMTMRNKEGIEAGKEAYRLLPPDAPFSTRKDVLQELVLGCSSTKDKDLMKVLDEYRSFLDKMYSNHYPVLSKKNAYLLLESLYADYYIYHGRTEEAVPYLKEMDKNFFSECYIPCRGLYYDVYSRYYKAIHEYDKALVCADSTISLLSNIADNDGLNIGINRASILVDAGRLDEAIPLFQKLLAQKDTFHRNLSTSQINEIYEMYNINNLILEKEQHKTMKRYIIIAVIAIALLILIPSTIRIYSVRKRLKKEEEECRAMSMIAEEANEVKSRFLANMSYNIRIPLNNVLGFSQLMTTDVENIDATQWKAYTEIIQANSAELIQLVNDVLDLSRLEAGKTKWQLDECEIIQLCSDITSMVHMKCGDKIYINFYSDIDVQMITADNNRLTQVILSTLIYADPCEKSRNVSFYLNRDNERKMLVFRIVNSPLADAQLQTQKTEIRHNINRMTIEYFGGTYTIEPNAATGATISFTYPYGNQT